jgi:hypothetical protein
MKGIEYIRQFYSPVQPTVSENENVDYTEYWPDAQLQHFIHCYWMLKTNHPLHEPYQYQVVADGCIDIFFEVGQPNESFVMGFCSKFAQFPLKTTFHYVGIRFLPAIFPQLFSINASELSNKTEHLSAVVPSVYKFIGTHLSDLDEMDKIIPNLDCFFTQLLARKSIHIDHRFYNALHIILRSSGTVQVEKDLETGVSPRQLRRMFDKYIGDSAKAFSKVVRFQHFLKSKPSKQSIRQNKLFFDVGYYDQSHFIREFKTFYGNTPGQAFEID